VVDRLKRYRVGLEELAQARARPDITRNVEWFHPCVDLLRNFDWDRFEGRGSGTEAIHVRTPNVVERSECPDGTWYVQEGVHRTLVAAVLLCQRSIPWRPFTVLQADLLQW